MCGFIWLESLVICIMDFDFFPLIAQQSIFLVLSETTADPRPQISDVTRKGGYV